MSILLFSLISFLALREFVTLAPTRPGDHRALFWSFFIVTPLQYYLIWIEWYGLFSILIPVYVSIFLAIRTRWPATPSASSSARRSTSGG